MKFIHILRPTAAMAWLTLCAALVVVHPALALPGVELMRLPVGAMQPVALTDAGGTVHLVWLQGDPKASEVYYQCLPAGLTNGSHPIQVNAVANTGIAMGTVRGVTLALGRNGKVHVVWNGSSVSAKDSKQGSPIFYSRSNSDRTAFETPINLLGQTANLDGGASVAADTDGRVFVVWHAQPINDTGDESRRRVFLAQSSDDGKTFQPERVVSLENGVCGCCGLRTFSGAAGELFVLYRAALSATDRPMTLIASRDHGVTFQRVLKDAWTVGGCPMSTSSASSTADVTVAAWETRAEITLGFLAGTNVPRQVKVSEGQGNKHPAVTVNSQGSILVAWAEGTGWAHGGSVAWRELDAKGNPIGAISHREGLTVWNFPAAFARPDGTFVVAF